jgi:hypothetical protein
MGNWKKLFLRSIGAPSKTVRKVVAICVKSKTEYCHPNRGARREYEGLTVNRLDGDEGHVIGTQVVDLEDNSFFFWILSKTSCRSLGFETFFLQGATAAIVVLELSDWETIRSSSELLRKMCKEFSIPVFLLVGAKVGADAVSLNSFVQLGKTALKVISHAQHALTSDQFATKWER